MNHRDPDAPSRAPSERRAVERRVELAVFLVCVAVVVGVGLVARERGALSPPPTSAGLSWPDR